ncbi:replication initiation protein [Allofrancisella guangzhouensis]|uniref:replication initiation protein n=3 Tax=Pseudomonadota TaxID=1224 RepID=UPI00190670C5|nr:replication initiation protein [Allofrancisella guangzhouensis]MBK2044851.1 replication initiation protein [Allofrancisella guangzhouensis]
MRKLGNNKTLAAHNKLIKGRYNLSREEQNFIYLMVSQINKDDTDFFEYKIHISELESRELTQKNYKQYREFAQGLVGKTITIEDDKEILTTAWFSSLKYTKGTGQITAKFDPNLRPLLLELKEEFVQAKLPTLLQFKSKYSSRLYLFLKSEYDRQKSYKSNLYIQYEVKYLHKMFEMPQCYLDRYSKFKDMFLNKGIEEINEITNLDVTFKEEKTGRKITSITFCIKEKKNESEDISLEFLKSQLLTMKTKSDYLPNNLNSRSISILLDDKLGLQENDFKKIFSKYSIDTVEKACDDVYKSWDNSKLNSKLALFRKKLQEYNNN